MPVIIEFSRCKSTYSSAKFELTIKMEPVPLLPGVDNSRGTGFEGHEFYEASSIRKFKNHYYCIYSSFLSHELAYAMSDIPNGGFHYCGALHSNGNIGYKGKQKPEYYWGNNHGSVVCVNDKYYVFAHRQTNIDEHSRQGIAEPILMNEDGTFEMAEMTSSGLNDGPLPAQGNYEAGIACVLYGKAGACKITDGSNWTKKHRPRITQEGGDREENPCQYVSNITNGTVIGYKYFHSLKNKSIVFNIRGRAKGKIIVSTSSNGSPIAELKIGKNELKIGQVKAAMKVSDGVFPLYFRFCGRGKMDLIRFGFEE